jgi:hypothetical protein
VAAGTLCQQSWQGASDVQKGATEVANKAPQERATLGEGSQVVVTPPG